MDPALKTHIDGHRDEVFTEILDSTEQTAEKCLLWKGPHTDTAYIWGTSVTGGQLASTAARALYYVLFGSEPPEGKVIFKTCENPDCINPDHFNVQERGTVRYTGSKHRRLLAGFVKPSKRAGSNRKKGVRTGGNLRKAAGGPSTTTKKAQYLEIISTLPQGTLRLVSEVVQSLQKEGLVGKGQRNRAA